MDLEHQVEELPSFGLFFFCLIKAIRQVVLIAYRAAARPPAFLQLPWSLYEGR